MNHGFDFTAAKPKKLYAGDDAPYTQPMRGNRKILKNPSTDQKRVRRAQTRKQGNALMDFQQMETALLRAMASAKTLSEQAVLAEELQSLRATHAAEIKAERDIEWADTVVEATLTPAWRGSQHTAASDWLDEVAPAESENAHTAMMAEASVWFGRTSPEVRADNEEFTIQATGAARRLAGQYGTGADAAARAFLDYVAFLHSREAASTLDQIEQTTAPDGVTEKPTQLPTETFDNFAPELASGNQPGKPSTDNPLLAEIQSTSPFGEHVEGRPSEHDTSGTQVGHYGPPPVTSSLEENDADPFGWLYSRSLALNYSGSLADWTERLAVEAAEEAKQCSSCGCKKISCKSCKGGTCCTPKEGSYEHVADYIVTEAASTLDQIQQTTAPDGVTFKPTPIPGEVAFPLQGEFEHEESTGAEGGEVPARHVESPAPQQGAKTSDKKKKTKKEEQDARGTYNPSHHDFDGDEDEDDGNSKESSLTVEADMFGASDTEHKVPGHERDGYDSETYNSSKSAEHPHGEKDEPGTSKNQVGPKHKTLHGDGTPAHHTTTNPPKVPAGSIGGHGEFAASKDYTKAYKYASAWQPGTPLVQTGTPDFEVGLYDGIKDNEIRNRLAWVAAHKQQSIQYGYLADRLVVHAQRTATLRREARLQSLAGTNTDLDTIAPSTHPETYNTPLSGQGRPGPLDGQQDVNAPAGAAPYNGTEPKGHGVVPGVNQTPPTAGPTDPRKTQKSMYDGPLNKGDGPQTSSFSGQTLAFRQRVQAALLVENTDVAEEGSNV